MMRCAPGILLLALCGPVVSMAQRSMYQIIKDDEVVGSIAASRTQTGDRTLYIMTSYSIMDVIWEQVVSTAVTAEYVGGALRACRSSVHVNGSVRDSSHMSPQANGHLCYVHPKEPFHREQAPAWTTARMYFEEPSGQDLIFVESVLEPCSLRTTGAGSYVLTFPNGAENRYRYADGELQEVHVDRTFLDLVFRRTAD